MKDDHEAQGKLDIMIVEDDALLNTVMSIQLNSAGMSVRAARTGHEALRKIEERVPSVLILDVGLPDMTAFELVQELRKNPATSGMNLIVHTTLDLSTKEQAKLMLGTTMFITKATACSFALAESVFKLARQQSDPGAK